jgi:hypothetical protein
VQFLDEVLAAARPGPRRMTSMESHWIAVAFTVATVALLYRKITSVARLTTILWAGMIVTVLLYLAACYSHFSPHLAFTFPPGAFALGHGLFWTGLGAALTLAIHLDRQRPAQARVGRARRRGDHHPDHLDRVRLGVHRAAGRLQAAVQRGQGTAVLPPVRPAAPAAALPAHLAGSTRSPACSP